MQMYTIQQGFYTPGQKEPAKYLLFYFHPMNKNTPAKMVTYFALDKSENLFFLRRIGAPEFFISPPCEKSPISDMMTVFVS